MTTCGNAKLGPLDNIAQCQLDHLVHVVCHIFNNIFDILAAFCTYTFSLTCFQKKKLSGNKSGL